ncbi:MAG: efflux RND transporter periplasmic adaptor subunit [Vicinamibacterales bacterium]
MPSTRSRAAYVVSGLAVLGVGAYVLSNLNAAHADFDPSRLTSVERGTMVRSVVATGKIQPITKIEIKSKANGIIEALRVDVGDGVSPGDVLVELDKENLVARAREARASLEAAEAGARAAEAQLQKNTIEAEGPDVEFARRAQARMKQLFEQQLVPQSDLDNATSLLEVAINKQRSATAQLPVTRAKVAEAQAQAAQARAAVERADEELRNATLRSPIRGTVLTRDVELGSPVSSILNMGSMATLVMTLGDIRQVYVRGQVDEADIGRVRLGQPARISVETFKERRFDGKVTQISPIGVEKDNVTTFAVEVSIDNPGNELRANMTANAEIVLEEQPNALIVPEAAIAYDADKKPFVEVPSPGAPGNRKKVAVTLGISSGTRTQIVDGLKEGDKVILPS